jgi:hypothetical protein
MYYTQALPAQTEEKKDTSGRQLGMIIALIGLFVVTSTFSVKLAKANGDFKKAYSEWSAYLKK